MFFELIFVTLALSVVNGDCDSCNIPLKHYKELGCKPVKNSESNCCANRYECGNTTNLVSDKCYYNGVTYEAREPLSQDNMKGLCVAGCFCDTHYNTAKFTCANIECAEMFHRPDPECISQYSHDKCCAIRTICDQIEKANLATCNFEGTIYHEGQKMYPKNETCYSCICAANFDSSTIVDNPNCKEINCGVGLRSFSNVIAGCIPIYYGTNRCCPIGWKCPQENDQMISNEGRSATEESDDNLTCKFGKLDLKIYDTIVSTNKCEECKCVVPPMAHCIQKPQC